MKKFITTILLNVILFNAAGYEIIFACLLINCGEEVRDNESCYQTTLVINSTNLDKLIRKNKTEIIYEGVLYDVKDEKVVGKYLVIHCKMDKEEQEVLDYFVAFHAEKDKKNSNKPIEAYIYKNQLTLFFADNFLKIEPQLNSNQIVTYERFHYLQPEIKLLTPPPQVHLS